VSPNRLAARSTLESNPEEINMRIAKDPVIAFFLIAATVLTLGGCGCGDTVNEELPMLVSPPTVESFQEVTVLAQFDEDVFMDGPVDARNIRAVVEDATGATIGRFSYRKAVFDFEEHDSLDVDGVVLAGAVIDAATLELVVTFDESTGNQSVSVTVIADDDGVECGSSISGEATLVVL
jgi:hypothetical protein